jgi:hypothetical protein
MHNYYIPLFFTLILSLLVIWALYPLNKGATVLVFLLCGGLVSLVNVLVKAYKKKSEDEK